MISRIQGKVCSMAHLHAGGRLVGLGGVDYESLPLLCINRVAGVQSAQRTAAADQALRFLIPQSAQQRLLTLDRY